MTKLVTPAACAAKLAPIRMKRSARGWFVVHNSTPPGVLEESALQVIRKANRSDAMSLSRLAEATFRETFGPANTAQDMDLHCQSSYSEEFQADEIVDPKMVTLLAEHQEELVGFAQLRWGSAPGFVPGNTPGEILRLYVAGNLHGKGIAQALMSACLDELQARGSDVVWLGVWERNPRAIAFYRKLGFAECGEHVFALGHDPQRDIVMARAV